VVTDHAFAERIDSEICAFGLKVRVDWPRDASDCNLTADPTSDRLDVDLIVHLLAQNGLNGRTTKSSPHPSRAKTLLMRSQPDLDGARFVFRSGNGTSEFVLSRPAREMWVTWGVEAPVDEVISLLFNSVLPLAARFMGRTCLHASVVARDGRAVAFVAPSGGGKSTIAASLIEQGYRGMTDDAAALSRAGDRLMVHPGLPQIGLRMPSLEVLPRFRAESSIVTDDKRRFALTADANDALRFEAQALPLAAIYFLRRSPLTEDVEIFAVQPAEALRLLMESLYPASTAPLKRHSIAKHLDNVSLAARVVPCRNLVIPDSLASLPMVHDRLGEDFRKLESERFG
jgi:hypothetical protein